MYLLLKVSFVTDDQTLNVAQPIQGLFLNSADCLYVCSAVMLHFLRE